MRQTFAFWFPQVHPRSFHKGDELDILVGQLISHEVTYPIDFYKLNWCDSVAGHSYDPTLGISANEIHMSESPYDVSNLKSITARVLVPIRSLQDLKHYLHKDTKRNANRIIQVYHRERISLQIIPR